MLIVAQLVKKYRVLKIRHSILSSSSPMPTTVSSPFPLKPILKLSSHLRLSISNLYLGFPIKILYRVFEFLLLCKMYRHPFSSSHPNKIGRRLKFRHLINMHLFLPLLGPGVLSTCPTDPFKLSYFLGRAK
jgi:hypothetical protein